MARVQIPSSGQDVVKHYPGELSAMGNASQTPFPVGWSSSAASERGWGSGGAWGQQLTEQLWVRGDPCPPQGRVLQVWEDMCRGAGGVQPLLCPSTAAVGSFGCLVQTWERHKPRDFGVPSQWGHGEGGKPTNPCVMVAVSTHTSATQRGKQLEAAAG